MRRVSVWVCLCICGAAAQLQDLYEGDVCRQNGTTLWTCKTIEDCPKAQKALKEGKTPPTCRLDALRPVVCCEPDVQTPPWGSKSRQMCKKYAESVFAKVEDPLSNGVKTIDTCGKIESPLVPFGYRAQPREYPQMALIGYGSKESPQWLCGGSLVSERFILTVAHCTVAGRWGLAKWVRLGEYNIRTNKEEGDDEKPVDYEIIERFNHPEFKLPSLYNDIALFKLDRDVQFDEFIRPACLQTDHQFAKTYATAAGWDIGHPGNQNDIIEKVTLTILPRKQCSDGYHNVTGGRLSQGIQDLTMLCVGDMSRRNMCRGDTGGTLQVTLKDPYCMDNLVGINSFGRRCYTDTPQVYTRISHYVPWIESVVWP